jgi:hypothetical protein
MAEVQDTLLSDTITYKALPTPVSLGFMGLQYVPAEGKLAAHQESGRIPN